MIAAIIGANNAPKKIKSVVPFIVSNGFGWFEKREINHAPMSASKVLPVAVRIERKNTELKDNSEAVNT